MTTLENIKGREVRLFSSIHIANDKEAEIRATAALLSIVKAVSEFGRLFVKLCGGPSGKIDCYTEIQFPDLVKKSGPRPDGIVVVTRGATEWLAMVEVKVGSNGLNQEQFDTYHVLAKDHKFDALITVSNQPALPNGMPPLKVHKGRAKGVSAIHLSWERLLSEAQMLSWQSGVSDADQRYILDEWIRYVTDSSSKIVVAPMVGSYWKNLLIQAADSKLGSIKSEVEEFVHSWVGFLRVEAFRLRAMLGANVELRLTRAENDSPDLYTKRLVSEAIQNNWVESALKIPHTTGDLEVTFDIKAKAIFLQVQVKPPSDKTTRGQIGWIVSQLKKVEEAPSDLMLYADWKRKGVISCTAIKGIAETRDELMISTAKELVDKDNEIRVFRIQHVSQIPKKSSEFFKSIDQRIRYFYRSIVEHLSVYVPSAPKVSTKSEIQVDHAELTSLVPPSHIGRAVENVIENPIDGTDEERTDLK